MLGIEEIDDIELNEDNSEDDDDSYDDDDDDEEQPLVDVNIKTFDATTTESRDRRASLAKPPSNGNILNSDSSKPKEKKLTRREQRRQIDRKAKKILSSPEISKSSFIQNLELGYFLSPSLIFIFQIVLISVYGVYTLLAILLLIFYILDIEMKTFSHHIVGNSDIIMIIFLCFNILLSFIGCFVSFKIGEANDNAQILANIFVGLRENESECHTISNFMVEDGDNFLLKSNVFISSQRDVKFIATAALAKVHRLGITLSRIGKETEDPTIQKISHSVQLVYQSMYFEYLKMRTLQSRSEIIKAFYSKQLSNDNKLGLNRQEFELLKTRLDDESSDKFHQDFVFSFDFDDFDLDNNGNVDILEFEYVVKQKYEQLLEKHLAIYRKGLSPETLAHEKDIKRRESMTENARLRRMSSFSGVAPQRLPLY